MANNAARFSQSKWLLANHLCPFAYIVGRFSAFALGGEPGCEIALQISVAAAAPFVSQNYLFVGYV